MTVVIFYVVIAFLPIVSTVYTTANAATLRTQIFANYEAKDRPTNQTIINVDMGIMHITEFDIIMQKLDCLGFLTAQWQDDRLKWNASDVGGMDSFFAYRSEVWSPPLTIVNVADDINIINDNGDMESNPVLLASDGNVTWVVPVNLIAQCTVNIKYYPFDTQVCTISIAPLMYLEEHVKLTSTAKDVYYDLYEESGEWAILGSDITESHRKLSGMTISGIEFTFRLKRKYSYYVLNMLLPVLAIASIGPFVFVLPVEGGDKIGFTLTILLSLSVVLSIVSDSIPPTSTHICGLSVYVILTFILCTVETLVTVYTCRWHKWASEGEKLSHRAQKFTKFLAKVTLSRHYKVNNSNDDGLDATEDPKQLDKNGPKEKAWESDKKNKKNFEDPYDKHYSYNDFILLFDRFNFILFNILNLFITFITILTLAIGGMSYED